MAVKIRLTRKGCKKVPHYDIVVAQDKSRRDGRPIEKLGRYQPLLSKEDEGRFVINAESTKKWLSTGAQPTKVITRHLKKLQII